MKLALSQMKAVSFHDATMQAVEARADYIRIKINFAFIGPPLEEAEEKEWTLRECSFECLGVRKSEKEEWDDTRAPKPHSDPDHPLEVILNNDVKAGALELSGFMRGNKWGVWRIEAREFELTWKTKEEFKAG